MPSGSHGGGSHFSGGGSFGGGSGGSHGGGSFGGVDGSRGPIRFHIGPRFYIISGQRANAFSMLIMLILIGIFLIFSMSSSISLNNKRLKIIHTDREYYIDMIDYAQADSSRGLITEGRVTDKFYNSDVDSWYFTYEIEYVQNGETQSLNGESCYVYTNETIKNIRIGDVMLFAVNSNPITADTDSVNVDYKDIPLTDDGEYMQCINSRKVCVVVLIVAIIAIAGSVFGIVTIIKKSRQKEEALAAEAKAKETAEQKRLNRHCPYCNSKLDPNDKKCDNCGASLE